MIAIISSSSSSRVELNNRLPLRRHIAAAPFFLLSFCCFYFSAVTIAADPVPGGVDSVARVQQLFGPRSRQVLSLTNYKEKNNL
jgi:hypothetical protein